MVALTAQGWLSAVLGHGMGSSHVGAGVRIWIDGFVMPDSQGIKVKAVGVSVVAIGR